MPQKPKSPPSALELNPQFGRLMTQLINNRDFVVILGAGCSISCGLPNFETLKRKVLWQLLGCLPANKGSKSLPEVDLARFDVEWTKAHRVDRRDAITNILPEPASELRGYYALAELIIRGAFRMIINYNVDTCLESALHSLRFDNFLLLVNGCHESAFIERTLTDSLFRTTILKTHGDHRHGFYAFSKREMIECHQRLNSVFAQITRKHLLLVGYSGNDYPFMRSIDCTTEGGAVWFVNPSKPPDYLAQIMQIRGSEENHIPSTFDDFFKAVEASLRRHSADKLTSPKTTSKVPRVRATVRVLNSLGLHARPVALLVKTANKFSCNIFLSKGGETVNLKSVMGLLMMAARKDDELTVTAAGPESDKAITEIVDLFSKGFYEF